MPKATLAVNPFIVVWSIIRGLRKKSTSKITMHSNFGINAIRLRFSRSLEVHRAILYSVAGRVWSLGAGVITTLLVAVYFSRELQGYYYTFGSVLALQVLAELGLGTVLISYASHEWANLSFDEKRRIAGDKEALSRLTSLGRFSRSWYLVAGVVVAIALSISGLLFFGASVDPAFQWRAPWIALCMVTGLNLCVVPVLALLEGCNQVVYVYGCRLIQFIACSVAAWISIYMGAELWVSSITGLVGLIVAIILTSRRYWEFVRTIFFRKPGGRHINWQTEILPMQWRIAVSWISGMLAFSLFTPVLFHYHGAVVAGQMGMTWAFVNALTAVASALTMPKAPIFGILIAQKKYAELDGMFFRLTMSVIAITATIALAIWSLIFTLNQLHHSFSTRVLSPTATGFLLLASLLVAATLPMATYLRAHKKEPLMMVSILTGLVTAVVVVVLGKFYSADGVAVGYLMVTAVVSPLVAFIWQRRRAEWHSHPLSA